jgi:acetylornithine deacetylase
VRACQSALAACGLASELVVAAFGTDAGPLEAAGMPGVVLGPGSVDQAHTKDEYVPLPELLAMERFLARLLTG